MPMAIVLLPFGLVSSKDPKILVPDMPMLPAPGAVVLPRVIKSPVTVSEPCKCVSPDMLTPSLICMALESAEDIALTSISAPMLSFPPLADKITPSILIEPGPT